MKKGDFVFPLIFLSSFAIFFQSLNYYFFQDDWFVLNWVNSANPLSLFAFRSDIIYWRPLTMPVFFALGKAFFNLNPLGYHLIAFLFHFINILLVYLLLKELKVKNNYAKLGSFLYATSVIHFIGLSWVSTTSYVIGPTLIFNSILLLLKEKLKSSFAFFLLALASTELAVLTIPLALISKGVKIENLKKLTPFISIIALYLVLRFLIFPIPAKGQYQILINLNVIVNLIWYLAWSFNFAEKFSTIFFISNFKQFPSLLSQFFPQLILPSLLLFSFFSSLFFLKIEKRKILLSLCWFLTGILPVLFIPYHTYPIYLVISLVGLIYLLVSILEMFDAKRKILIPAISILWFFSSYLTTNFTRSNHWITNEQSISKAYATYALQQIKNPPENSVFVFRPANDNYSKANDFVLVETEENLKQAFNDQDAIRVLYGNQTLKSVFLTWQQSEDIKSSPTFEIAPK